MGSAFLVAQIPVTLILVVPLTKKTETVHYSIARY